MICKIGLGDSLRADFAARTVQVFTDADNLQRKCLRGFRLCIM
jgi:hypothetical protein